MGQLNGVTGVDDRAVWWLIGVVFWGIILFIVIRVGVAMIFAM